MPEIDFSRFTQWDADEVQAVDISEKVRRRIVSLSENYPPVQFLLRNEYDENLLPRCNIIALTGKAKRGKSYVSAIWEASLIGTDSFWFKANESGVKLLHCDTEMDLNSVASRKRIVHTACDLPANVDDPRLITLALREDATADRWPIIREAIEIYRPDLVTIDGIRDLTDDFNDLGESSSLINELMRSASKYNCAILCIIHENEGDGKMRGHLGTELLNKCFEVYECTRNQETGLITVKQKDQRGAPVEKFSFSIGNDGIPIRTMAVSNREFKEAEKQQTEKDRFEALFKRQSSYSYTQLVKDFQEIGGCKERAAQAHIGGAMINGIICKGEDGNYKLQLNEE